MGAAPRRFVAAIDSVTGIATAWSPEPNGGITCLAVSGPTVYLGGNFTYVSGRPRNSIAVVAAATGVPTPWTCDVNAQVNAINVASTVVYIGGEFTAVRNLPLGGLAVTATTLLGVPAMPGRESVARLQQNAPNPFRSQTRIRFTLGRGDDVTVRVFDVAGREVATLVNHASLQAGPHELAFDGRGLPSGVYLCRLDAGPASETRRIVLAH